MKKYLFCVIAILIAAGTVAFTPKGPYLTYFSFTGSASNPADIEDLAMWLEATESESCCASNQACQIAIEESSLNGMMNTGRRLDFAAPTLVLDARDIEYEDFLYQPTFVSGPTIIILNKP